MDDGFDITFREVMPESGVVELVIRELAQVKERGGLHCSVVVRRVDSAALPYGVCVELRSSARALPARRADAIDADPYYALRLAFAALRASDARPGLQRAADNNEARSSLRCVG